MLQKGELCYTSQLIGSHDIRLAMYMSLVSQSNVIAEKHIVYVFSTGTIEYVMLAVAIPKD